MIGRRLAAFELESGFETLQSKKRFPRAFFSSNEPFNGLN
jgi:hypothetical protein